MSSLDTERWTMALHAHAAEHQAMRDRGLARRVTLGACSRCPDLARIQRNLRTKGALRGLGELSPMSKTIAAAGVIGGITIGFLGLLVWAQRRAS